MKLKLPRAMICAMIQCDAFVNYKFPSAKVKSLPIRSWLDPLCREHSAGMVISCVRLVSFVLFFLHVRRVMQCLSFLLLRRYDYDQGYRFDPLILVSARPSLRCPVKPNLETELVRSETVLAVIMLRLISYVCFTRSK